MIHNGLVSVCGVYLFATDVLSWPKFDLSCNWKDILLFQPWLAEVLGFYSLKKCKNKDCYLKAVIHPFMCSIFYFSAALDKAALVNDFIWTMDLMACVWKGSYTPDRQSAFRHCEGSLCLYVLHCWYWTSTYWKAFFFSVREINHWLAVHANPSEERKGARHCSIHDVHPFWCSLLYFSPQPLHRYHLRPFKSGNFNQWGVKNAAKS